MLPMDYTPRFLPTNDTVFSTPVYKPSKRTLLLFNDMWLSTSDDANAPVSVPGIIYEIGRALHGNNRNKRYNRARCLDSRRQLLKVCRRRRLPSP